MAKSPHLAPHLLWVSSRTPYRRDNRVRWSNRTRNLLLTAALVSLCTACGGDECRRGEARCDDNVAEYCDYASSDSGILRWLGTDCGAAYCKLSKDPASPHPFCAKSAEPDPRCVPASDFEFCEGNQVTGCHQGYVEHTVDCTTGAVFGPAYWMNPVTVGACVGHERTALCVPSSEPNGACPTNTTASAGFTTLRSVCAGNQILSCFYEYLVQIDATCSASGACVSIGDVHFCALETATNPSCPATAMAGAEPSFCRNGIIEFCTSGWVIREEVCAAGTTCVNMSGGFAVCQVAQSP